jgi:hypothetical protein
MLGVALGFLGLPRIELPQSQLQIAEPAAAPTPVPVQPIALNQLEVAPPPPLATPTPLATRVLFDQPVTQPVADWPNDRNNTAWFDYTGYHLFAREPGRFVAVGVPVETPVGDATLRAQFQKVGGPSGGGYGLLLRDESPAMVRDGRNQLGQYMVLEVGDRGDVGIWQRDQTGFDDVVPWTHSDAVHLDGAPNELAVVAHGSRLHFVVNGSTVADVNYDRIPATGGVGVFVGGDLNEVVLQMLRIQTP